MPSKREPKSIVGRRLRERREALGLSQEQVGVAIGLDESTARARISRYELGVHEPPHETVKRLAQALNVPSTYFYCEEQVIADLLLALYQLPAEGQRLLISSLMARVGDAGSAHFDVP